LSTLEVIREGVLMFRNILTVILAAVMGFGLLWPAGSALAGKADAAEKDDTPPIILISCDTTRRDAVSIYGYGNGQTPNIDKLAEDSVLFTNAFSLVPHTLPSHMAVFTGVRPDVHGVFGRKNSLSDDVKTIPQLLKEGKGYYTAGVYAFWWLKPEYGFGKGYDYYQYEDYGLRHAERVNNHVAKVVTEKLPKDKDKFFLFFHYYDAHSDFIKGQQLPYLAPPILIKKYTQGYTGDFSGGEQNTENYASPYLIMVNKDEKLRNNFPAVDLKYIKGLYAAGVEYMDLNIGVMMKFLKEQGIYDKAYIILMGDHGEEFLDHNMFIHEQMYDELVKVPLMIKFPHSEHAGERKDQLVELIDILPTIMDIAGVKKPYYIQGQSLMDIINGKKWNKEYVFIRDPHQMNGHAIRTNTEKLIVKGNKVEYYNLKLDPGEKTPIRNIKAIPPEIIEKFKACMVENSGLAKLLGRGTKHVEMSKEEEDRLRSLGYIQ